LFGRQGENQAFFTRRIGLTDDGAPVPIDYGVKVTGKIGPYNIGLLQVQTRKLGKDSTGLRIPRQRLLSSESSGTFLSGHISEQ